MKNDWIKIEAGTDIDSMPPQYKPVLFFDKSDRKKKIGMLCHGLFDAGYHYKLEGKDYQDKNHNLVYWQQLPEDPKEFLDLYAIEDSDRLNDFLKDIDLI